MVPERAYQATPVTPAYPTHASARREIRGIGEGSPGSRTAQA
ncbi:MAG: hypothetical protein ACK53G_05390 [Armatimonadota bacterium]